MYDVCQCKLWVDKGSKHMGFLNVTCSSVYFLFRNQQQMHYLFLFSKIEKDVVLDYKVRVLQLHYLSELQLHLCSYLALASI